MTQQREKVGLGYRQKQITTWALFTANSKTKHKFSDFKVLCIPFSVFAFCFSASKLTSWQAKITSGGYIKPLTQIKVSSLQESTDHWLHCSLSVSVWIRSSNNCGGSDVAQCMICSRRCCWFTKCKWKSFLSAQIFKQMLHCQGLSSPCKDLCRKYKPRSSKLIRQCWQR